MIRIENSNISINQQTYTPKTTASATGYWSIDNNTPSNESSPKESASSEITLSTEGKQRSQDYGQALKQSIDDSDAAKEAQLKEESGDMIDKQIERVKEQMQAVQEQISALQGDKSEAAADEMKVLTSQLMALNAQLVALTEQKLLKAKQAQAT